MVSNLAILYHVALFYLSNNGQVKATSKYDITTAPDIAWTDATIYSGSNNTSSSAPIRPQPYSLAFLIIVGALILILSLVTIIGNLFVLLAFYLDKNIRQPTNYFILSLAVSDFIIGFEGFPLFSVLVLHQSWPLGWFICDFWLSVDYTVCLASIYTVLLITIDRYCSVRRPTTYRNWRTPRKVQIMIISVWFVPTILFFVSIFGWSSFSGKRQIADHQCFVQFMQNKYFNMSMYIGYYWSTLVVMIVLYGGIYVAAYKLQKKSELKHRRMSMIRVMGRKPLVENSCANDAEDSFCPPRKSLLSKAKHNIAGHDPHVDKSAACRSEGVHKSSSSIFTSDVEDSLVADAPEGKRVHISGRKTRKSMLLPRNIIRHLRGRPVLPSVHRSREPSLRDGHRLTGDATTAKQVCENINKQLAASDHAQNKDTESPYKTSTVSIACIPASQGTPSTLQCDTGFAGDDSDTLMVEPDMDQPLNSSTPDPDNAEAEPCPTESASRKSSNKDDVENTEATNPTGNFEPAHMSRFSTELARRLRFIDQDSFTNTFSTRSESVDSSSSIFSYFDSPAVHSLAESNYNLDAHEFSDISFVTALDAVIEDKPLKCVPPTGIPIPMACLMKSDSVHSNTSFNSKPRSRRKLRETVSSPVAYMAKTSPSEQSKPKEENHCNQASEHGTNSKQSGCPIIITPETTYYCTLIVEPNNQYQPVRAHPTRESVYSRFRSMGPEIWNRIRKNMSKRSDPSERKHSIKSNSLSLLHRILTIRRFNISQRKKSRSENRARKALRVITIILGAFVLFWTPFYVCATIYGFCNKCVPQWLYNLSYYLCYLNSTINPFCYALANAQFKKVFLRLLKGDLHKT